MQPSQLPTPEDVRAAYRQGEGAVVALVDSLQAVIRTLEARIGQLEARPNKDSHNSHQPPSSDGPAKRPRPRSLRKRSGKKSGGQAGHPGVTCALVDDPDTVVPHVPTVCAGCGASLESAPEIGRDRRQVIEIPKPRCASKATRPRWAHQRFHWPA